MARHRTPRGAKSRGKAKKGTAGKALLIGSMAVVRAIGTDTTAKYGIQPASAHN